MADSPQLGGSGLSDDEDVLDPLIRALGDLDDIDLEIDTKMFDGEGSASSFTTSPRRPSRPMAAAASQRAPAPAPAVAAAPVPAAAPPPPQPRPQPVPAAAPPPQQPPQQPAVDPMAAERAALYPPPDQPPRKLDWGEENGGAAPKRKSGSQYDIAPVIRRRHSKEEWSSEIDAGDGTRPKRRNSGDARDADWHLKNNMFGDDGEGTDTARAVAVPAVVDMADLHRISSTASTTSFSNVVNSNGNRASMAKTHISSSNNTNFPRGDTRAMLARRNGP